MENENLEVLTWLIKHEVRPSSAPILSAVLWNKMAVLERLDDESTVVLLSQDNSTVVNQVAAQRNYTMLEWLSARGIHPNSEALNRAVRQDDIEMLDWLHGHGVLPDKRIFTEAFTAHGMAALNWLEAHEFLYIDDPHICLQIATEQNSLEKLIWLRSKGYLPDRDLAHACVVAEQWEIFEWIVSQGVVPDCDRLACEGRLEALKIARKHGTLPTVNGQRRAAAQGEVEILDWLEEQGMTFDPCMLNSEAWPTSTLEWLKQRSMIPGVVCANTAVITNNIPCLEWLKSHGVLPNKMGLNSAIHDQAKKWIEANRDLLDT
jgi:hypothetical protein